MTGLIISLLSAVLVIVSLREAGRCFFRSVQYKGAFIGLELSFGFVCFHFLFMLLSVLVSPGHAQYGMFIVHAGMNMLAISRLRLVKQKNTISQRALLFALLLCPLFIRTISPCVNADSLNVYLPNIEWVVHQGLAFNPYLTGYTTMPMGAEYLFSQVYAWGGQDAVRILDAFLGVIVLMTIFNWVSKQWPGNVKWLLLALILLMPGGFRFLFGNGKVDMLSTLVVLTGVMSLPVKNQGDVSSAVRALFLFSLACALKYTNWILLCLPMLALIIRIFGNTSSRWRWAAPMIPLAFVMPVLIRNQILTGNPLAPLLDSPDQFVFISSHGGIPNGPIEAVSLALSSDMYVVDRVSLIVQDLMPYVLFPAVAILAFLVWFTREIGKTQRAWIEWLGLSILPFYGFVSISVQPVRFLLPQLIVSLLLFVGFMRLFMSDLKVFYFNGLNRAVRPILLFLMFIFIWGLEGRWFSQFVRSFNMTTREWYAEMGEDHAAITLGLMEGGYLTSGKILWHDRPVLGLVPFQEWGGVPTDLELFRNRMGLMRLRSGESLEFCQGSSCNLITNRCGSVLLVHGPWRLASCQTADVR